MGGNSKSLPVEIKNNSCCIYKRLHKIICTINLKQQIEENEKSSHIIGIVFHGKKKILYQLFYLTLPIALRLVGLYYQICAMSNLQGAFGMLD